jgi:capsular polysaccharide export protein
VTEHKPRHFLFLQGPHGPFLNRLGKMLRRAGADVTRVGFNAGDRFFWRDKASYIGFTQSLDAWPAALADILATRGITDIVLYGDTRPIHAEAVRQATALGLRVHVLEEGYLRPYWATYERGGSNGHSRLTEMSIDEMRAALEMSDPDAPIPSGSHWGEMRQHIFLWRALSLVRHVREPRLSRRPAPSRTAGCDRIASLSWASCLYAGARD